MGYDYSESLLTTNKDLVEQFVKLARDRAIAFVRCPDSDMMMRTRYFYNNILATLAMLHPEAAFVRTLVRTWTQYDDKTGEWTLFVGVPTHKLRGRSVPTITRPSPIAIQQQPEQPLAGTAVDPTVVAVTDQYTDGTLLAMVQRITKLNDQQALRTIIFTNLAVTKPEHVLVPYLTSLADRGGWCVTKQEQQGGKLVALEITRPEYRPLLTFEEPDATGV